MFLVRKVLAPTNATVTESRMLKDRETGDEREVDICIETEIAGHPVNGSISEALGHADLKTTSRYLASTIKNLDDAMRRKEAHRTAIRNGFANPSADEPATEPAEQAANPANLLN